MRHRLMRFQISFYDRSATLLYVRNFSLEIGASFPNCRVAI